ncbi:putative gpH domain protein [Escherichia phage phAPEC8] [Escherichia phage vB_Eco_Alma]|nr:putative gpH domain protein [Escherichia phage phAPEC8] [Escherichia phage vB_Eco_Alma]
MSKPSFPLEIWAEEDQVLPNTHRQNRLRPIDDLWRKGWDLGQKPSCEELNYIFNMLGTWAKYIADEQIPAQEGRYLVT